MKLGLAVDHEAARGDGNNAAFECPQDIAIQSLTPQIIGESMKPTVVLTTSAGEITIELLEDEAPITVKNFLDYVDKQFYDDTIFHRVIPDFMVQGGGLTADMKEKDTSKPIRNEAENGLKNRRGWLSMARTSDADSATAQFFINLKDNAFLDHTARDFGYAVFAQVTDGMDVVDSMAKVETAGKSFHENVPVEPLVIRTARRADSAGD